MRKHFSFAAFATTALVGCTAVAAENTMTAAGYTGLEITPNAHLLGWGQFAFTYDNQLPGARDSSGHNFVTGFGLLPNLEVTGRLAANSPLQANCFMERCGGIRDLSASAKFGIGLDTHNRFRIAGGAADIGGAATNFRTYYGVLTYSGETVEVSGGLARRGSSAGRTTRSPLDGPFASAAWQPLPWVRGQVEYVDHNAWAGVRLFAPQDWLPQGWSAHVGANARLTDSNVTARSWFTAGITIPLYRVPAGPGRANTPPPTLAGNQQPLPTYEARVAPAPSTTVSPGAPARRASPAAPATDAALLQLAALLREKGLEDISVGRMPDASIAVRANNATYNWNAVDALGVGLGAVAQALGDTPTAYRFLLTQRQVPLVAVTGQADCLRDWIREANPACTAGELSTPGTMALSHLQEGATWVVQGLQPSWKTLRVALSPVLRTNLATEVGTLDYSAGINVGFTQPLWSGASAEWRVQTELARSDDYAPDGVFGSRRIRTGTERLALTQTMRLPIEQWPGQASDLDVRRRGLGAVTAQASIGRFGHHFDGVHGSLRWEPGEGRHKVTAQGGWLHNSQFGLVRGEPRNATPLLLSYRYNVAPTRTYLEATGGRFMNSDRGVQLGLRQWFGDVSVQAYYRRSTFSTTGTRSMAGLEISVPIGPRKDMNPSFFQVTGTPRFAHAIETEVGNRFNRVGGGYGVMPPTPSLDAVHNSDRASLLYFEDNIQRIRDAARW